MKKIITVIALSILVLPALALAQGGPPETCTLVRDFTGLDPLCTSGALVNIAEQGICCAFNSLQRVIDVIFLGLLFISIILFLVGAYTLITAAGVPERVGSGRNFLMFAILGLAVAFLARAVPAVARFLIGA